MQLISRQITYGHISQTDNLLQCYFLLFATGLCNSGENEDSREPKIYPVAIVILLFVMYIFPTLTKSWVLSPLHKKFLRALKYGAIIYYCNLFELSSVNK